MRILIRRGLDVDRQNFLLAEGEPGWTTDTKRLYIGDGVTFGGIEIGGSGAVSTGQFFSLSNALINPGFRVAQRWILRNPLLSGEYAADRWRWKTWGATPPTISSQVASSYDAALWGLGINQLLRLGVLSMGTPGVGISAYLAQVVRTSDLPELLGKSVTFSIYVRNEDAATDQPIGLHIEDGTNQAVSEVLVPAVGSSPSAPFSRYSVTLPNVSGWVRCRVFLQGSTSDGFSADFGPAVASPISLAGAQLSATSAPVPFIALDYDRELARCLPYFQKSYRSGIDIGSTAATDMNSATGQEWRSVEDMATGEFRGVSVRWPTPMRGTPAAFIYDSSGTPIRADGYLDAFTSQGSIPVNLRGTSDRGAIWTPQNNLAVVVNGIGFHWAAELTPDY